MKSFIFILLIGAGFVTHAEDLYPKTLTVEAKELKLRGWGYFLATMFKVKIYHSALYVTDLEADPLKTDTLQAIDLTFDYDLRGDDMIKGWKKSFDENCAADCKVSVEARNRFLGNLREVAKGAHVRYVFFADRVEVTDPAGVKSTYKDPLFPKFLLSTWIGEHPSNPKLAKAMRGG